MGLAGTGTTLFPDKTSPADESRCGRPLCCTLVHSRADGFGARQTGNTRRIDHEKRHEMTQSVAQNATGLVVSRTWVV